MWNARPQTSYVVRFFVALLTTDLLTLISPHPAWRQSGQPFKIGIVTDMSLRT
jgi:hypothetical protein